MVGKYTSTDADKTLICVNGDVLMDTPSRSPSDLMLPSQKDEWSTRGYQSSTIEVNVEVEEEFDDSYLYTNGNFSDPCMPKYDRSVEKDLMDVIRSTDDFDLNVDMGHHDEQDAPSPIVPF